MAVLVFIIGFLASVVVTIWIYVKWKRTRSLPPGPSGLWLLFRHYVCGRPLHDELSKLTARHGEVVTVLAWAHPIIILNNAYAIEQGLNCRGFTFTGRRGPFWMPGLKYRQYQCGIHEMEGIEWRQLHGVLSRGLLKCLERLPDVVEASARPRNAVVLDLKTFCIEFSTRVFRTLFFGNILCDEDFDCIDLSLIFAMQHSLVWHYFHGSNIVSDFMRTYRKMINDLDAAVWNALEQAIEERRRQEETEAEERLNGTLLEELLQEELSNETRVANLSTLFTFAAASCALQLQWCLLFALEHEMSRHLSGPSERMAFVKEVLRLRPILPLGYPRRVLHSTQLFGFHIPRDAMVLTNIQAANSDPTLWDDPMEFRPERFLGEKTRETFSLGSGRRCCLGSDLALQTLPQALGAIFTNYEVKSRDQVSLKPLQSSLLQQPQTTRVVFCRTTNHE